MSQHTKSSPRISIVIAMHNASATIETALRSLQRQTVDAWEAIVIDDGSTDDGGSIVARIAASDPRIVLHRQANAGPGAARNAGLDRCRGSHIAFLDADDWMEPAAYATLLSAVEDHPAAVGLCAHCDEDGRILSWPQSLRRGEVGLLALLSSEVFAIHAQLIRRDIVGEARFRTHLNCFEDLDFFLRLAERGVRWKPIPEVVCTYRQRPLDRGGPEFARKFATVRRVYTDCFARVRTLGPNVELAGFDASQGELDRLLFARAVTYATMMVLQDRTEAKDHAASVLRGSPHGLRMTPEAAAHAAHGYLPWSESRDISCWPRHLDRYTQALGPWWMRCIAEDWAEPDLIDRTVPLLARRIANELDIPERLVRRLDPSRPITILGGGRNGVRLARALAIRGVPFVIRDNRPEACDEIAAASHGLARRAEASDPFDPAAQHVMTLLDDAGYLRTLPRGLRCIRWSDIVDVEARELADRLREGLHQTC